MRLIWKLGTVCCLRWALTWGGTEYRLSQNAAATRTRTLGSTPTPPHPCPTHRKPGIVSLLHFCFPGLVSWPRMQFCWGQRNILCFLWGPIYLGNEQNSSLIHSLKKLKNNLQTILKMGDYVRTENNGMVMDREAAVRQTEGLNDCRFLWRMLFNVPCQLYPLRVIPCHKLGTELTSTPSSRHGDEVLFMEMMRMRFCVRYLHWAECCFQKDPS